MLEKNYEIWYLKSRIIVWVNVANTTIIQSITHHFSVEKVYYLLNTVWQRTPLEKKASIDWFASVPGTTRRVFDVEMHLFRMYYLSELHKYYLKQPNSLEKPANK